MDEKTGKNKSGLNNHADLTHELDSRMETYARLTSDSPNPILRISRDGRILFANVAAGPMLAEWKGNAGGFAPVEIRELIGRSFSEAGIEKIVEVKIGESYFSLLFVPLPGEGAVNVYGSDVTYLKKAQEALAESGEKYRLLVENSPEGIARLGSEGQFILVNNRFLELSGLNEEDFKSKEIDFFFDFCDKDDVPRIAAKLYDSFIEEKRTSVEYRVKTGNGRIQWISQIVYPWYDRNGALGGVEIIARDITDIKRSEQERQSLLEQLCNSQKLEAVGMLAGGLAHDFNNVLSVILGNAQLGLRQTTDGETGYIEFREIVNSTELAKGLTMKLLSLARKDKYDVKFVDANKIVDDLAGMLTGGVSKKIIIVKELEAGVCGMQADSNRIHLALLNICTNALEAMPEDGSLTLRTKVVKYERGDLPSAEMEPGKYCLIEVEDTGMGIDESVIQRIFDPFYTTKPKGKGAGLGLFISFGVVKNHGGHILVTSKKDEGTKFRIYFPHSGDAPAEAEPEAVQGEVRGGNEIILLVDDERPVLKIASRILADLGYVTLTADSGAEAVDIYRKNKDKIDMVMLDIIMPEMDGPEVFAALKKINPGVKVLLASGFSVEGQLEELARLGAKGFLQKPFKVDELSMMIRKILDA